jgi:hypothetical protein
MEKYIDKYGLPRVGTEWFHKVDGVILKAEKKRTSVRWGIKEVIFTERTSGLAYYYRRRVFPDNFIPVILLN